MTRDFRVYLFWCVILPLGIPILTWFIILSIRNNCSWDSVFGRTEFLLFSAVLSGENLAELMSLSTILKQRNDEDEGSDKEKKDKYYLKASLHHFCSFALAGTLFASLIVYSISSALNGQGLHFLTQCIIVIVTAACVFALLSWLSFNDLRKNQFNNKSI